jgi:hypothetical protein
MPSRLPQSLGLIKVDIRDNWSSHHNINRYSNFLQYNIHCQSSLTDYHPLHGVCIGQAALFHILQVFHNLNAHEATLVFTSTSTYLLAFSFHLVIAYGISFLGQNEAAIGWPAHEWEGTHKPHRFLFQLCRFLFDLYVVARLVPLASNRCSECSILTVEFVSNQNQGRIYLQHALCDSFKQQARYIFFPFIDVSAIYPRSLANCFRRRQPGRRVET